MVKASCILLGNTFNTLLYKKGRKKGVRRRRRRGKKGGKEEKADSQPARPQTDTPDTPETRGRKGVRPSCSCSFSCCLSAPSSPSCRRRPRPRPRRPFSSGGRPVPPSPLFPCVFRPRCRPRCHETKCQFKCASKVGEMRASLGCVGEGGAREVLDPFIWGVVLLGGPATRSPARRGVQPTMGAHQHPRQFAQRRRGRRRGRKEKRAGSGKRKLLPVGQGGGDGPVDLTSPHVPSLQALGSQNGPADRARDETC